MTKLTNQQILEKVIQRAIDGGWGGFSPTTRVDGYGFDHDGQLFVMYKTKTSQSSETFPDIHSETDLIFSHDFAKALWGEEDVPYNTWTKRNYSAGGGGPDEDWYDGQMWEFHLQQLVLADDPIEYLGRNI